MRYKMKLLTFSLLVASCLLVASVNADASNSPKLESDDGEEYETEFYEYLSLWEILWETMSYEDFCYYPQQIRKNEYLSNIMIQLQELDIHTNAMWAFIDKQVDCQGSDADKIKFQKFVENIVRLARTVHKGVLKAIEGYNKLREEL